MRAINNALQVKTAALYGKLLDNSEYKTLIEAKSRETFLQILKERSPYLQKEKSNNLRDLEHDFKLVRKKNIDSLKYFMNDREKEFLEAYMLSEELIEFKSFVKMLVMTDRSNYQKFINHSLFKKELNLEEDSKIAIEKYLAGLEDRPYFRVLETYLTEKSEPFDKRLLSLEMNLDRWYYFNLLNKSNLLDKDNGKAFREFIGKKIDLINIEWIYRLVSYKKKVGFIGEPWIESGERLNEDVLKNISSMNQSDLLIWIGNSNYSTLIPEDINLDYEMDVNSRRVEAKLSKSLFRNSRSTMNKVVAYCNLSLFEIMDLTRILEGHDLGLSGTQINKYLILREIEERRNVQ